MDCAARNALQSRISRPSKIYRTRGGGAAVDPRAIFGSSFSGSRIRADQFSSRSVAAQE